MKVPVIGGSELAAGEIARWREILESSGHLVSPYLTPDYVLATAAVRPDIRVAVMERGSRVEGFFAFQDVAPGIAEAVTDKISDCHAVIASRDFAWTASDLLRGVGLAAWHYRRVPVEQTQFEAYHSELFRSPLVDLTAGFEAYAAARHGAGSRILPKLTAMEERLERAAGPVRFEPRCIEPAALHALLRCKSEQYRRTGYFDRFELAWIVALLERLQATWTPQFAGMLSVLWAGDEMAAAHFGMRSASVWNYWFPCFNRKFAAFSPGLILLAKILRSAAESGIRIVELGAGDALYKDRFANGSRMLARGCAVAERE